MCQRVWDVLQRVVFHFQLATLSGASFFNFFPDSLLSLCLILVVLILGRYQHVLDAHFFPPGVSSKPKRRIFVPAFYLVSVDALFLFAIFVRLTGAKTSRLDYSSFCSHVPSFLSLLRDNRSARWSEL